MIYNDRNGDRITEGSRIGIDYGIPPSVAVGSIYRKRGVLMFHCENARPHHIRLSKLDLRDVTLDRPS